MSGKYKHVFEKGLTSVLIKLDLYSRRESIQKWSYSYRVKCLRNKKGFKFHSKLPYLLYQAVLMLCCIDVVHPLLGLTGLSSGVQFKAERTFAYSN